MELNKNRGDLLTTSLKGWGVFFLARCRIIEENKVKKTSVERRYQSPFPVSAARFASVHPQAVDLRHV